MRACYPADRPTAPGHRDGILLGSWAAHWVGEITETVDDRDDPAKRARFTR
ncbi:hypothetical protein [Streptomyces sp. SD31]|uniref:hypothetical protein n=1 Tax=Streptomyces sp. SD31 TaxID=3452208 RepID=UPI003F8A25E6